jgi:N-acetylglucosaminyl-diphospho-decaprenol L-rhamnosyltransferase
VTSFPFEPVDVCAIVVSHDSREWLDAALDSLADHAGDVSMEAIVVDNGADGAGEYAASRFDFVRAIACENRGFGHANNRGFAAANARFVLFLNPDTELLAGELDSLVAAMERMPDVGLAGVRQVNADGALAPSIRRFPSVPRALAEALPVERLPLARRVLGERVLDPADYDRIVECDWTSGSAMFARSAAIEEVGGFDERFFLFSEETDLCWRIRRNRWRIVHIPDVTIRHFEQGHSSNPRLWAQSAYARLQFAHKNLRHPRAYRAALALRYGARTGIYSLPGACADASRRDASRAALAAVLREEAPLA